MHTIALLGLAAASASFPAGAAEPQPERPTLPSFSLAGEDGAATLWSNPSSLGFDPDPSAWLAWDQRATGGPGTVSAALQRGPLAIGALYRNGASEQGWLSLTDAIGLKLGRRISVGLATGWQIPEGPENNFLTWDMSASWRPAEWLGVALVAQNLNNPAEDLGVNQSFGGGIALRPFADRVLLGVDYRQSELAPNVTGTFSASARLVPVEGLVVRLSGDQTGQLGAGVELYWGRTGVGLHGNGPGTDPSQARATGYLITADGDHNVFSHGRQVPEFVLDHAFPDQPKPSIFDRPTETWLHLIQRIQAAIEDPAVKGFVLHIDRAPGSWARVQELRDLVAQARSHGKITAAYLDRDAGNAAYLTAVATDRVYLHPAANLDFVGLSMELSYMRGALDLVGIKPQYV
ncbi:MAG: hypothetical protein GXP62_13785, partial [Oligoflexia bacterium]|nr:hypothetical protein [Oligoflexia bacterium]